MFIWYDFIIKDMIQLYIYKNKENKRKKFYLMHTILININ